MNTCGLVLDPTVDWIPRGLSYEKQDGANFMYTEHLDIHGDQYIKYC